MVRISRLYSVLTLAVTTFIFSVAFVAPVSAVDDVPVRETGCSGDSRVFYDGSLESPKDTYDVYIKLGTRGQQASVSAFVQLDVGSDRCVSLGSVDASGDEWRKLGSYSDTGVGPVSFQVASAALSDVPTANRPTLLLLSQANPVCAPKIECETTVDGQPAYVRAPGNTLADNALRIVRVDSLADSEVVSVKYYVDNELMYTTKQLEAFDLRSIPYYGNKLIRVVEYASGQTAVIEGEIPAGHTDTLVSTLARTFRKYRDIVLVAIAVILLLIFVKMIKALVLHIEHHREWLIAHGLVTHRPEPALTPERKKKLHRRQILHGIYNASEVVIFVAVIAAAIVMILSTYVVQLGAVSGGSMVASFEDGQRIVINRIPVTVARINNEFYTPARNEVVVAYPNFGGSETVLNSEENNTIIKRVVGLPGDRVVVSNGNITIFNKEHKDGYDPSVGTKWAANVQPDTTALYIDVTLAENEVFLCGDNRPESIDSRYNGPISLSQIVGVVHEFK